MTATAEMGCRLRTARIARGLSRQALADSAGLTFRCIQSIERGCRWPRSGTADALIDALGFNFMISSVEIDDAETEVEWIRCYAHWRGNVAEARIYCGAEAWAWCVEPAVEGESGERGFSCPGAAKVAATKFMHAAGYGARGRAWEIDG